VKVIAFGKAALGMVACLESLLGEHIVEGVASVPVAPWRQRRQPYLSTCPERTVTSGGER